MPESPTAHTRTQRRLRAAGGLLPAVGIALLFAACSPSGPPPAAEPPPPLTVSQQSTAVTRGKAIAAETFGILSTNLQTALAAGGVSNALPFCSLAAAPLTASVGERQGVKVRRVSHKPRNPGARASAEELSVLSGFRAVLAVGGQPAPFATNLVAGQATFLAPIVINNALCLKCHGVPGQDIPAENLAVIQQHYPQDEATGFKLGDLRGAWRIDFPLARLAGDAQNNETK